MSGWAADLTEQFLHGAKKIDGDGRDEIRSSTPERSGKFIEVKTTQ